jgi:hypothetical protein
MVRRAALRMYDKTRPDWTFLWLFGLDRGRRLGLRVAFSGLNLMSRPPGLSARCGCHRTPGCEPRPKFADGVFRFARLNAIAGAHRHISSLFRSEHKCTNAGECP